MNRTPTPGGRARHALLALALAAGALMVAFVAYDLRREYAAEIEAAGAATRNLARIQEEHARQSLRRVELIMAQGADEILRAGDLSRMDAAALRQRLASHLSRDGFVAGLSIVDRDGAVVVSTRTGDARTVPSVADRDYFVAQRERAGLGLVIGAAVKSRVDGKWVMPASLRLEGPGGAFHGILLGTVDPSRMQHFYDSIDTGANGFVTLFQRQGWILVRAPFNEEMLGRNWAASPMFREHLPASAAKTVRQVVAADGVERIYSYRALADFPVIAAVGLSLTDILSRWRARAWREGLALLAALAALAGAMLVLNRQLRGREAAEGESRRLSAIVESTSDWVAMTRADGQLVYLNAAARRAVGIGADEDLARYHTEQFYAPGRWALMQQVARPAAAKHGVWAGENRLRTLDGREIDVDQVLVAYRGAHRSAAPVERAAGLPAARLARGDLYRPGAGRLRHHLHQRERARPARLRAGAVHCRSGVLGEPRPPGRPRTRACRRRGLRDPGRACAGIPLPPQGWLVALDAR